jgi:glycosyltransferase involved in cell wall biosynthesis
MKNAKLSFSIITPSFNQGAFLRQTIESVLTQKYIPVQYIVMDGGSTDDSKAILKSYGKKLWWQSKRDKGQSDAINQGLKKATGDIIAYINSDDYYLPGALYTVAQIFLENPEVMWVVGDALIVDERGEHIQSFIQKYKQFWRKIYQPYVLNVLNPLPQPAVFWRATATQKIGAFNQELHYTMDYEYWHRLQKTFGPPHRIKTPLAAFRIHKGSKGVTAYQKQFQEEEKVEITYNRNLLLHLLHKLHNQCILLAYGLIKQ